MVHCFILRSFALTSPILEEPMPALKDGITVGGNFVIQHQEKETMASVLLAGEGEYTLLYR